MKKLVLFIAAVAFCHGLALAQSCLPEGITFTTQAQIDSFQVNYPGCTEIEGDVTINGNNITNLNEFSVLTSIGGFLVIGDYDGGGNPSLISLIGLENLASVGENLAIGNNDALTSMPGLENLVSIGGDLDIWGNDALTSLIGLENLATIGGSLFIGNYYFGGNTALVSLTGLENLEAIGGNLDIFDNDVLPILTGLDNLASIGGYLSIFDCSALASLVGLENLTTIGGSLLIGGCCGSNPSLASLTGLENLEAIGGDFSIYECYALASLTGLENLTTIGGSLFIGGYDGGNPSLTSLTGMENLNSIGGDFTIINNEALSTCDAEWFCTYLTAPGGTVNIYNNASGCSSSIEVAYACDGLPCLPYGNYYFGSQSDVDLFAQAFPGCTEVEGNVTISGNDIINFNGLNLLTYIGGDLDIYNNAALTSLTGLENLSSIGGWLGIHGNVALTSLTGLENLSSIGGYLGIGANGNLTSLTGLENLSSIGGFLKIGDYYYGGNPSLASLTGLDNIDAGSIENLYINKNGLLATCEVQSICDYLAAPNGSVSIHGNAPGCNNPEEVEEACEALGIEDYNPSFNIQHSTFNIQISPNPFTRQTTLEFTLQQGGPVHLAIYNQMGKKVAVPVDEYMPFGVHTVSWNAAGLPAGIYLVRLQAGGQVETAKVILQK